MSERLDRRRKRPLPSSVYAAFMPPAPIPHRPLMPVGGSQDAPQQKGHTMLDIVYLLIAAGFFLAAAASLRILERL